MTPYMKDLLGELGCILDMDLFAFIHTPDHTKVKVVEQERVEDEPLLLQTIVGRMVPPLSVALDRAKSELEASVDKNFNDGGSGNQTEQGGFASSGRGVDVQLASEATYTVTEDVGGFTSSGRGVDVQLASEATYTVTEDVVPLQPRCQRKRKTMVMGAGEASHPSKKLREDHENLSGPYVADSSHHSGAIVAEAEFDSLVRSFVPVMTVVTTVTSMVDLVLVVKEKPIKPSLFFIDSSLAGGADPNTSVFSDLFGSDLLVFVSVREMKHDQLFTEFNVGAARQMSLSVEIEDLKAQMLLQEAEVVEAIRLRAEASNFEIVEKSLRDEVNALKERNIILEKERNALDMKVTDLEASVVAVYEDCMGQLEKFQDDRMKEVNDKFDRLYVDFIEMALHLEESGYWKAIEKGMQDGLSIGITHGAKGRALTDVVASNKDASTNTLMNILHLEETLAERLGFTELQPHVDQLMVPIHHSPDKVVVGATTLSLALDASNIRVWEIRENITGQRSALRDIFIPLSEAFSAEVLTGVGGTSNTVPTATVTTTALSTTLASASTIAPISVDDYEVVRTDDQAGADPFPNVVDAELNIP
nr:hypothetical protein [Tanacetum cinerariifolium]